MSLDLPSRAGSAHVFETEFESDFDPDAGPPWMENVMTAAGAALTVLFVSSVAMLMYLA